MPARVERLVVATPFVVINFDHWFVRSYFV
jgi:hypothetical protein